MGVNSRMGDSSAINLTMKKLLLFCLAFIQLEIGVAQNWTWAETAGGTLPDEANGCTVDSGGNIYVSGFYFSSSIDFGNGNSLSNAGLSDGFIVKYNVTGSAQWVSKIKGSKEDKSTKCAVDNAGNVIVTGYFDSPSIQFGGNNAHNVSNFDASGNTFDCFIVKYDASGTPLWFQAIGKNDDDGGSSVATDNFGNIYVTGWFRAPSITAGSFTLYNTNSAGGSSDMFLIKYDPNGNVLWAKNAGGTDDDKGNGCVVDIFGNVIVSGYCKGDSINLEGNNYLTNGGKDVFVVKYSANGTFMAGKVFGGSGGEEAFACSTDADGNVFMCGSFSSGNVVFDADTVTNTGSGSAVFLAKLNSSLNTLWALGASSSSNDQARGCSTDTYGNTVITGVFNGPSITFGNTVLNNNGGDEIFLAKYDRNGNLLWAKKAGKSKDDGSNDCFIDNNGRVLIAGYYNSSSLTFGSINLNNSYVGISTSDVFVATTCNTLKGIYTQTSCNSFIWIDGNTYTNNNNTATFSLPSAAANGCDSMVTLNLTITAVDTGITVAIPYLTANSTNATYRWLDCQNSFAFLPGETNQTFTAFGNGSYAVEVTKNSCVDTSACILISTVGFGEKEIFNQTTIYPNPTTGIVNFDVGLFKNVSVNVSNTNGKSVYNKAYTQTGTFQFELNEAPGIYFVEVVYKGEKFRYKLVLE